MKINKDLIISDTTTSLGGVITNMNGLKGTILWANPNPTSNFTKQTITLSSDDYDIYEIFYSSSVASAKIMSDKSFSGQGFKLNTKIGSNELCDREIEYQDKTSLVVYGAYVNDALRNECLIPLYIIGYKTGLFN